MIRLLLLNIIILQSLITYAQTPLQIVSMGNSITQGKVSGSTITEKSYRPWLWEKLDSAGVDINMVGYLNTFFGESATNLVATPVSRYTGKTFDRDHEAYYGIRSTEFLNGDPSTGWTGLPLPKLSDRLKNYTADIALIHLGTNTEKRMPDGTIDKETGATTASNIKLIIDELRKKNPNVVVFVAKLITGWSEINSKVDEIVTDKSTATSPVIAVDLTTGFINDKDAPGTMTFDWVHPNEKGQKFMADRWYKAIMDQRRLTSTTDFESSKTIAVYPTISKGNLTIENCNDSEISIYNINGSQVKTFTTTADLENLNLSELSNGMYVMKISREGKVSSKTFMIEK